MTGRTPTMALAPTAVPRLWRLARIGFDRVRQRPVLLYPEGAMFINETGKAILELCDGTRSVDRIAGELGQRYSADVRADVSEFLERMARRDMVVFPSGGYETPTSVAEEPRASVPAGVPAPSPAPAGPSARRTPTTLLAELTYRCPLHCPYCSNPLEMTRAEQELSTDDWKRVFSQARALGVLQLGLSGGEPLVRKDLEQLVAHAREEGMYSTLVTSALGLTRARGERLKEAGVDHVQISFQDTDAANADRIAGIKLGKQKYEAAALVKELGLAFSVNVVLHRGNLDRLGEIIDMAARLGADRLELANTQYYGWAAKNRRMLMPTPEQVERSRAIGEAALKAYKGRMQIIYVLPDYYERYPKPCYGGWGNVYVLVTPDGKALPCHGATQIGNLQFVNVRDHALDWIWERSPIFNAFRGDAWMKEPCRSCPRKSQDFGGCRCQAFALTGDATNTDPVCSLSPRHDIIERALADTAEPSEYIYRYIGAEAEAGTAS
ncbi:MAG TPA: pyrroloquinoline quinone biosynthesis protein PqqE, partial [Gemmatimonadales bacterium]|nr:pyrroloquinoline quinone biosynthesis protein PqqE [Gemmatimonadales bacterium]